MITRNSEFPMLIDCKKKNYENGRRVKFLDFIDKITK